MKPQPKQKPCRNPKYMEWVRGLSCCLTGHIANDWLANDPHHEPEPGHGGMGTKPCDSRCIPIRHDLHVLMESPGHSRKAIQGLYDVDFEAVIIKCRQLWIKQGGAMFW